MSDDHPVLDAETDRKGRRDEDDQPDHPDEAANLAERGDGAHAEQIGDRANLRAPGDEDPPGSDRDS